MATARSTVRPVPQQNSRRRLLLLILVAAAAIGGFLYIHNAGGSSKSAHKHQGVAAGGKHSYAQRVSKMTGTQRGLVQRAQFARRILPTLYRATPVFDRAAGDASNASGDLSSLEQVCNNYGTQITTMTAQVEGVPHPWAWYTPAGAWRHDLIGVYHYMLGALQQCQTAASDGDGASAGSAISDMSTAAQDLHGQVGWGQYFLAHP